MEFREQLLERFLRYVAIDTQSDPDSETFPSSAKQLNLLNLLLEEMIGMGLTETEIDPNGYVMGTIPATPGLEEKPVIGFISHVDTSPEMSGADIQPRLIENYDGKDIRLNRDLVMKVSEFPELAFFKGHTLITTDGTTLLGADDKAGVAEIMTMACWLMDHPEIAHGKIRIAFTPDEEIGRGVDYFNVEGSEPGLPTRWTAGSKANSNTKTSMPPAQKSPFKAGTSIRAMPKTRWSMPCT